MKQTIVVLTARPYDIPANAEKNQRANKGVSFYYYIPGSNSDVERLGDDVIKDSGPDTLIGALRAVPLPGSFEAEVVIKNVQGKPTMKVIALTPSKG